VLVGTEQTAWRKPRFRPASEHGRHDFLSVSERPVRTRQHHSDVEQNYGDWDSIFGDPIIATAILDRLLHHSTTINIRGESYRLKDRRKAGLFPRPEEEADRPAPFPSPEILQNGPRRQDSTASRKTGAALTAPGRSTNAG
jgi:hypothetical protein